MSDERSWRQIQEAAQPPSNGVNTAHAYAEVDELLHEIGNTSATTAVKSLMALAWLKGKSAGLDDGLEAMRAVRAVRESHSVRA